MPGFWPPSPAIVAERDRIMALAGKALRADLLALAERYPRLKEPDGGPIRAVLEGNDPPGRLSIDLSRRLSPADQPPSQLIPSLEYDANFRLFVEPIDQATFIKQMKDRYYDGLVYPHLNLWGMREPAAADPFLARELRRIVDKHLAPLDALEARLNRSPIPASKGPSLLSP